MRLIIILPQEQAILATRRFTNAPQAAPVMHALDNDVFQYLCSKTDWATGQIGERSAISYARTALELTEDIPRKPKRSLRKVTRKCVQNSVQRLIKAGLFVSESVSELEQNCLLLRRVFWAALLRVDDVTKNPDSRQLTGFIHQFSKNSRLNNSDLNEYKKSANAVSYPSGGIYNKNVINITNAADKKFKMTLFWQADAKFVENFLQASGFSSQQIKQVWFGKYVQYWSLRDIRRTQSEWSAHYANHMQSYLLRPQFFEQVNGMLAEDMPNFNAQTSTNAKVKVNRRTKPKQGRALHVPNISDGTQLQAWAVTHGLPPSPVGFDTAAYRRFLCREVEKKA